MPRTVLAFADDIPLVDIGLVLQQQHQAGHTLVAVIGALPGVTDLLRQSIELGNYARVHTKLLSIHSSAARMLVRATNDRRLLVQDIIDILESYEWLGRSLVNRQPTPAETATILAVGERLSTRLLAGFLQFQGVQVRALNVREVIATDRDYLNATIDPVSTQTQAATKVNPLLDSQIVIIIGRNTGGSPQHQVTHLSTDGLYDVSALLAAATASTGLWIMSRHDGILTADPDIFPAAQSVAVITMDMLADLRGFGLDVPTEPMLRPAVAAHIPIFLRNVNNPTHPGTYLQPRVELASDATFIILTRRNVRLLTIDTDIDLQPALTAENIHTIVSGRKLIINNDHVNLARLALGRSHPGLRLTFEPQHYALILLIGMTTGLLNAIETALKEVNIGLYHTLITRITTENTFLSLLIDMESVEIAVEKIHTLTVRQSK